MASLWVFMTFHAKRLDVVFNLDVVTGNDLIEKGDSLVFRHVCDTEQTFTLRDVSFVISRGPFVGGIILANRPIVLCALLQDQHPVWLVIYCARFSRQGNARGSGADYY